MIVKTDILQGWSEIAAYLSRDVRTAKRWEKQRGLPVRRMQGGGRANVYAFITELDLWLSARGEVGTIPENVAGAAAPAGEEPEELTADGSEPEVSTSHIVDVAGSTVRDMETRVAGTRWVLRWPWMVGALCACVLVTTIVLRGAGRAGSAERVGRERVRVSPVPGTTASQVEELCLRGSYLFEQRTPEALGQAKLEFEEAIRRDPRYAPAYAGLAKVYDLLREYSMLPSSEAFPLAKQAAQRAIALDPKLADAHAALGFEEFFWDWDGKAAEQEFRAALALDPESGVAHLWYGSMLTHEARFAEALDQLNRAQALQPASAGVLRTRAYAIGLSGQRNEAADLLQDILTKVPDSAPLHYILAQLSLQEPRDIARYLDEMRRYAALRHDREQMRMLDAMDAAYRPRGEAAMWRAVLDNWERLHPPPEHHAYQVAEAEAALGDGEAALGDLQQLVKDHDAALTGMKIDPMLRPLRQDPRFAQILQAVSLPR